MPIFWAFKSVKICSVLLWVMTACNLIGIYQHFFQEFLPPSSGQKWRQLFSPLPHQNVDMQICIPGDNHFDSFTMCFHQTRDQVIDNILISILASNVQPSEEQVQTLMEMGFERARVLSALRSANNDIHSATNILLHES